MDFGILFILQATVLHPVDMDGRTKLYTFGIQNAALASGIAFLCAVINNFIWTRHWVYPESKKNSFRRQFAAFALLSIVGGVARTLWVSWSFLWVGETLMPYALPFIQIVRHGYVPSPQAPAKLGTMAAQMIGMVIVMLWNFFANRYITYRDVK
jgi:putative flippase GtrA